MRRSWHFVISIVAHVVIICHTFCVCWWQWRVCVCVHVQRIMKKQLGSSGEVKKKKVAAKRDIPLVDLSTCKYEVLRIALERNGWEEGSENNQNCHLVWTGKKLSLPLLFSFWLMGNWSIHSMLSVRAVNVKTYWLGVVFFWWVGDLWGVMKTQICQLVLRGYCLWNKGRKSTISMACSKSATRSHCFVPSPQCASMYVLACVVLSVYFFVLTTLLLPLYVLSGRATY